VLGDIESVLEAIAQAVGGPPSLALPLKGGGKWIAGLAHEGGGEVDL
jgi:hypothetical protein